jgi:hypothetical protein
MRLNSEVRPILALVALTLTAIAAWPLAARAQLIDSVERLESNPQRTQQLGTLSVGPDVTIIDLSGVDNHNNVGEACPPGYAGTCRGFSIGTNSCNIGSVPIDWCDSTSGCRNTTDEYHPVVATNTDHSVISQNLYRLKDGRFEQIGLSFLKHGFLSLNTGDSDCVWNDNGVPNSSCVGPPAGGQQLGVGCTDFYGAGLNGSRPMGRRSDVNGASADHPANPAGGQTDDSYDQRIVVSEADIDPALNAGALYWMEGQYTVRDDSRSGPTASPPAPLGEGEGTVNAWLGENGLNSASHRQATVDASLDIDMTGPTVRERAAIYAWQGVDPEVEIVNADRQTFFLGDPVDPPGAGTHPDHWVVERFEAARRVTQSLDGPFEFHYEYAIHNMNSDTSADGFVIDFPGNASIGNAGFTDVDHHSGEPYDTSDWTIAIDEPNGVISWSAVDMGANTNALRWGTTFTFWFDSDTPPTTMVHELDLFKIDEQLPVPFPSESELIFDDDFESGDTMNWDSVVTP